MVTVITKKFTGTESTLRELRNCESELRSVVDVHGLEQCLLCSVCVIDKGVQGNKNFS